MNFYRPFLLALLTSAFVVTPNVQAQKHAGKMDTDGILSPGEIPNPNIRYSYGRYPDFREQTRHNDHDYDDYHHGHGRDDSRWDRPSDRSFEGAINDGVRSGRISRNEEYELRGIANDISRRERDYRRDGRLSDWERDDIENRERSFYDKLDHELYDGEKRR